jgi:glycerol uptake facilitator-like aquaporin
VSAALARALTAEALGTALLLAVVVGSGIMGQRLSAGNDALALLANSLATGCGLAVLIAVLAPLSGAHFNPLVTLSLAARGTFPWRQVAPYIAVQVAGAAFGVIAAHFMFGEPAISAFARERSGIHQWFSEACATFGLLLVVWGCLRASAGTAALCVGAYITAAYWFTASTSFANPAVTFARGLTQTFAGIRMADVPGFIAAQLAGAAAATALAPWLFRDARRVPG